MLWVIYIYAGYDLVKEVVMRVPIPKMYIFLKYSLNILVLETVNFTNRYVQA